MLRTSEKAGNLIAKRPERKFSLRAATFQISAKAVAGDSVQLRPLWIGYRTLAKNLGERQLFELLTGRARYTAVILGTGGFGRNHH